MSATDPGVGKHTSDYITDLSVSFEIEPTKAALVVVDTQYATGSRQAGLGKRLTEAGIDSLLRSMGIEYLLFAGVSTNMCVGTTARDAADRGYRCVLIEDCCGAAQNEYHRWEVITFQRLFGRVESSDAVVAEIKRNLQ